VSNQLDEYRSRLRESLGIINELKAKVAAAERARNEPIAVVGMSCRLPGGSTSVDAFWNGLMRGVDGVNEIPATRWAATDIENAGTDVRWAALIDGIDQFDAAFFGISPREAASLDPQHRLLLELSWEAIEDAGLRSESLFRSKTGVYLGICTNDYWHGIVRRGTPSVDTYGATGNLLSTAAGRISYWLGLEGPCASVDTACSSSLVALNFACHGLQSGACDQALVAGVNAILSPFSMTMMSRLGALSQDGRCKTFDARANGYVRGEGCGVIVLKRLADARRDGDRIRAVILGSAINQDGRSTGLTTPNVLSQQALLRQALENARLSPDEIGYIETHGTGTPLGDPIEVDALKAVFGRPRQNQTPCILGAVKTNIGHLEGAAGIAGLIKVISCLERQAIPKNLHQRALNPRIDIDGTPFVIPKETVPWPRGAKPRRAGVSSFGISGTNAHVILEEAPPDLPASPPHEASAYLLPLSAKSPAALNALVRSYAALFSGTTNFALEDVAFTASARRTHHIHRTAIVARTRNEFANMLSALSRNEAPAGITQGRATNDPRRLIFVFSGQGSQWAGMGKTLVQEEPVFRAKLQEVDTLLRQHANFSLLEELAAGEDRSRLNETEIAQPALFGIQVALAALFKSWGIEPDAVVGHSVGEIAAAHTSGALTLEDAVRLVVLRGQIMQKATGNGKMAWISLPPETANRLLANRQDKLAIAAVNDPSSVVISGDTNALDELVGELERRSIVTRPLRVNYAFHSPQMDPLVKELVAKLGQLNAKQGTIPHYSTVTGTSIVGSSLHAEYWGRNIRATVDLATAIRTAIGDGYRTFVEIGPHPVLLANLQQCVAAQNAEARIVSSLRRNAEERRSLLETLGALHVDGIAVDWKSVCQQRGRVVSLPSYPWQKERFWVEPLRRTNAISGHGLHPLLGFQFDSSIAPGEHVWQQSLNIDGFAYLTDHRVQGEVVFPGAGFAEMAIAAAIAVHTPGTVVLDEVSLTSLLALAPDAERNVQAVLQKDEEGFAGIAISSRGNQEDSWTRHATVRLHVEDSSPRAHDSVREIESRCKTTIEHDAHYSRMNARGLNYGPAFRGVQQVRVGDGEALGRISLPELPAVNASGYRIHPALLDACLQAASWALEAKVGNAAIVPKEFLDLRYYGKPERQVWVHGIFRGVTEDGALSVGIVVYADSGQVLLEISEMRVATVDGQSHDAAEPFDELLYRLVWRPKELPATPLANTRTTGSWLIFSDTKGTGRAIAHRLRASGETCIEALAATRYGRTANGEYQLDPTDPSHLRQFLSEAFGTARVCKGVIHSLSLDSTAWEKTTSDSLLADIRRNCVSVLASTQALVTQGWRDVPRLYLLTRGVFAVEATKNEPIAVAQAPLWGLGRTIALEHPALECTRLDLPATSTANDVDAVVKELLTNDVEDQIALRGAGRFVARIVRDKIAAIPAREFTLRGDRTYLITGGLGGLGLELAQWLVQQDARHLVLVGRSAPNAQAVEALQQLKNAGATVHVAQVDVSQYQQLADLLASIKRDMPPLAGVIHAAAVLQDRTLLDMTEDVFMQVMDAKVLGALNLHALTASEPLDLFIVYSSVAGVLGSPGQGNYAAANAFLDALAQARVAAGLPASSIAWGPFTSVGLAASQGNRGQRLASRGFEGISPADGHAILAKLLMHPRPEVAAVRLSVRQWQEVLPQAASLPVLAELRAEISTPEATRDGARAFRGLLESTEPSRRSAVIKTHAMEQLGQVLRLDPSRIDPLATFASLGVDSLTSLELRNRLQGSLGLDLPATLLFTYPTLDKLVAHIIDKLALDGSNATTAAPVTTLPKSQIAPAEEQGDMGVDDLMALLDEELSATKKRG